MTRDARIVSAWLHGLRLDYIAHVEKVSLAEVERIVARASTKYTGAFRC